MAIHIAVWPIIIFVSWLEPRFGVCVVVAMFGWNATEVHRLRVQLLRHQQDQWLDSGRRCKCSHRQWQHGTDNECIHPQCSCTSFVPEDDVS